MADKDEKQDKPEAKEKSQPGEAEHGPEETTADADKHVSPETSPETGDDATTEDSNQSNQEMSSSEVSVTPGEVVTAKPDRRQIPVAIVVALAVALILLGLGYIAYVTSEDDNVTTGNISSNDSASAKTTPLKTAEVEDELDEVNSLVNDLDNLGELEDGLDDSNLGL